MSSVSRFSWLAASMLVVVVLACGITLTGCGPAPDDRTVSDPEPEPVVEPEPIVDPEPDPEPVVEPDPEPEPVVEPEPDSDPIVEPEPGPEPASGDVKISSFAPAADLAGRVEYYLGQLTRWVESEEDYAENQEKIAKDSSTIAVLALVLGLHDEDNQYKAAAPGLLEAAQQLAATSDYASARAATAAVVAAAASPSGDAGELKWEKVAPMSELMKQVPLVNTSLKRYIRRDLNRAAEYAALIAAIAHCTLDNADETEAPDQVEQWKAFSIQMRQAAGAVVAAAHAEDEAAVAAAMEPLAVSCEDCHAVFHKEEEEE
ncbi:MAG: hypothetical protein V3R99_09300 [Thermoguttaceae bacterium]